MSIATVPDIPAPPDATEVFDWTHHGPDLARRPFTGTVREACGFVVVIEGVQRENRTCSRQVTVEVDSVATRLELEAVRQVAAALTAAADEIADRQ